MEIFDSIKQRLEKISKYIELTEDEKTLLLSHDKISHSVLLVNGQKYDAWRIIHNKSLGPGKGGIRFHPDVSEDEIKSLSFWMSLKTSLMGLPLGGAKGGVRVNAKELNENEIEELSRGYIKAFIEVIGVTKDILAPDVYTNPKIMAWMLDEYEKIKKLFEPGMITGKPLSIGGISIRSDATSKGGFIVLKEFLNKINKKCEETKVAIQGFGNAGSYLASMLQKDCFTVTAVSDSKGGIYDESGLDVSKIVKLKNEGKNVSDYEGKKITNQEILELDVDVLILAALENQITEDNADNIKAKYILELANGPINFEADQILLEKNIIVIPDILANAGGVVASYFEWVQNKTGNIFEDNFLEGKLNDTMTTTFHKVYELYQEKKNGFNLRNASYIIAIKRILEAEKARGNL